MVLVVASASLAAAVIPTAVPLAAFSSTALAVPLASLTAPTLNSSTSLMLMVKFCSLVEPSAEVARTVMSCEAFASRLSSVPSATVTTPVLASMAKRPPALSVSE